MTSRQATVHSPLPLIAHSIHIAVACRLIVKVATQVYRALAHVRFIAAIGSIFAARRAGRALARMHMTAATMKTMTPSIG